jgi:hypothetical protein
MSRYKRAGVAAAMVAAMLLGAAPAGADPGLNCTTVNNGPNVVFGPSSIQTCKGGYPDYAVIITYCYPDGTCRIVDYTRR